MTRVNMVLTTKIGKIQKMLKIVDQQHPFSALRSSNRHNEECNEK